MPIKEHSVGGWYLMKEVEGEVGLLRRSRTGDGPVPDRKLTGRERSPLLNSSDCLITNYWR